jgi:integrase
MSSRVRIGLVQVRTMKPGQWLWDATLPAFYARRQRDSVGFGVFYRHAGRQRFYGLGRYPAVLPDQARTEAQRLLGLVAVGRDPAQERHEQRTAMTVAALCDLYAAEAVAGRVLLRRGEAKKASTISSDRSRIAHIKEVLGRLPVAAVTAQDVERLMHVIAEGGTSTAGGRGAASRTVGLLGAIFAFAVKRGLRLDNPTRNVTRFQDQRRERRLSPEEYARLGAAMRADNRSWPMTTACVRFLCLTGWRRGEALNLRWKHVDLVSRTATLPESKTGRTIRPLSHAACALLRGLPRLGDGEVAFAGPHGAPMGGFPRAFGRLVEAADLEDEVTPHTLRHSFASVAADLGYSELSIAALIGHKTASVTSRYVHTADAVLLAAADAVAERIGEMMGEPDADSVVVELHPRGAIR